MPRKSSLGSVALTALALCAAGCPGHIKDPGEFVGELDASGNGSCMLGVANVESSIFAARCGMSGCHDPVTHQQMLDLASPNVAARLINVPSTECTGHVLVVPGATPSGFLLDKLGGSPACGASMPLGLPALSTDEMNCVRAWISAQSTPPTDAGMPDVVQGMDVPQAMPDVQSDTGTDATPPMDVTPPDDVAVDVPTMSDTSVRDTAMPDTSTPDVQTDAGSTGTDASD